MSLWIFESLKLRENQEPPTTTTKHTHTHTPTSSTEKPRNPKQQTKKPTNRETYPPTDFPMQAWLVDNSTY